MRERIEAALLPLLGLPLTDSWRPDVEGFKSLQRFEFGEQRPGTNRKGKSRTFGDYALHVSCPWRIIGQSRVLAAAADLYFPADSPTESGGSEDFDCYAPGSNHRDRQVAHFVERLLGAPLIVESMEADEIGSVRLMLSKGYKLEIVPMDSLPFEFWRLLYIGAENGSKQHFVVTGQGIQE